MNEVILPKGIANVRLACGHVTQMKRVIAEIRMRDNVQSWCNQCGGFRHHAPRLQVVK